MEGKDAAYIDYDADSRMRAQLVDETKGMVATLEGDAALRDEMTFLFMALTVARGPAISDEARPNNAVKLADEGDSTTE